MRIWNTEHLAFIARIWRKGRAIHIVNPEHQQGYVSWKAEESWSSLLFVLYWSFWNLNYFWKFALVVGLTAVHIFGHQPWILLLPCCIVHRAITFFIFESPVFFLKTILSVLQWKFVEIKDSYYRLCMFYIQSICSSVCILGT